MPTKNLTTTRRGRRESKSAEPKPRSRKAAKPQPETPRDFFDKYFRERGSSLEAALREDSRILTATEMRNDYQKQFAATAITLPCVDPTNGVLLSRGRVRYADPPPIDDNGRPRKFNQPSEEPVPYIAYKTLGDWPAVCKDVKTDIYIGEGETRALAFAAHGRHFIALGGKDAGFIKGSHRSKLIAWFNNIKWKHRRVFIVPDSDWFTNADVRAAYSALATLLTELSAEVRIIKWRAIFSDKEGADDLIGMGCFAVIERLCETTPVWSEDSDAEWPEPQPFYRTLPAVPRMSADMLPESLRGWIVDESHRLGVPLEYIAVPSLYSLGLAVMTRAVIRPKSKDDWIVPGFLWCVVVALSGGKKTPAFKIAMKPIDSIEKRLREEAAKENKYHAVHRKHYEAQEADWNSKALKAVDEGNEMPAPLAIPEVPKDPPPARVLYWNSATVEALQLHQQSNGGIGCGYLRDELAGLLEELEKPTREGDRAYLIEGMEGGSFKSTRVTRGQTIVPKNAIAIGGTTQPSRIEKMILDGLKSGPSNDGLLPRLSLAVYPDPLPDEELGFVNETPDSAAYHRALRVYENLDRLDHKEPSLYRFDEWAQRLYGKWTMHAERYRRDAELPEIVKSHFTKYDRMVPALAMLFKLAEQYDGDGKDGTKNEVEVQHLQMAMRWAWFLERHAMRLYSVRMSPARAAAQTLARKIQLGKVSVTEGAFTLKSVYENDWAGLSTPDEARAAVNILIAYGWAREVPSAEGKRGRPSEQYKLNPRVTSEYPDVNAEKVQIERQKDSRISGGLEGRGLVPSYFWEEEENKNDSYPLPSKPTKLQKQRDSHTPSPSKYDKFTRQYRKAVQAAAQKPPKKHG